MIISLKDKTVKFKCLHCDSDSFEVYERRTECSGRLFGWEITCRECKGRFGLNCSVHLDKTYETTMFHVGGKV